jgi:hypothetical protein
VFERDRAIPLGGSKDIARAAARAARRKRAFATEHGYGAAEGGNPVRSVGRRQRMGVGSRRMFSVSRDMDLTFMACQMTFAIITPALIAGAYAERVKFRLGWIDGNVRQKANQSTGAAIAIAAHPSIRAGREHPWPMSVRLRLLIAGGSATSPRLWTRQRKRLERRRRLRRLSSLGLPFRVFRLQEADVGVCRASVYARPPRSNARGEPGQSPVRTTDRKTESR